MELQILTQATALSATVVLVLTELLKLVPVAFTTKYPAWVNGALSLVASFVVVNPTINVNDLPATLGTALVIAVTAAIAYNQFTSKIVNLGSTTN